MSSYVYYFQGANSITTFEILPQPPNERKSDNPWPTWPRIFRVDYGHEEVKIRFGKDPRIFSILSKVFILYYLHICLLLTLCIPSSMLRKNIKSDMKCCHIDHL